jgi:riboflavin synthase
LDLVRVDNLRMFTGIIETTGRIEESRAVEGGRRLRVNAGSVAEGVRVGDSICVQGICLTVTAVLGADLSFDVITETLHRSNLGETNVGDRLNLERSLRVGDRLDGHWVQGHVDGLATVIELRCSPAEHVVFLRPAPELAAYVIPKGSITLDGVSLTIAEVRKDAFSVALIPTTLERTTLGGVAVGSQVNVESDILARTIVRTLERWAEGSGVDWAARLGRGEA